MPCLFNSAITSFIISTSFAALYSYVDTTDRGMILQSELQNLRLTDSATLAEEGGYTGKLRGYAAVASYAEYLSSNIPTGNVQAANYTAMSNIYLQIATSGLDTFTNGQLDTIVGLAVQCPYIAGDAVYMARSLYAEIDNSVFFNDLVICQPSSHGFERSLMVSPPLDTASPQITPLEFVHLYPNPAKQIINLNFYAQTTGEVTLEIMDQLGDIVLSAKLGNGQTTAQYSISSLSNAIYYWRLRDSQRTIKVGKIAVMK